MNFKQSAANLEVSPDFRHLLKFLNSLSRWESLANLASDAVVVVVVEMMSWITSSLLLTWRFLQIGTYFNYLNSLSRRGASMANLASDAVVVVMVVVVVEMMSWITSSLLLTWRFLQIGTYFNYLNSLSRRGASMANLASDAVVVVEVVVEMMSWISSSLLLTWRFLQTFDIS